MTLRFVPVTLREANAFVEQHHRHHDPVAGCVCVLAVALEERIVGVAIVGRPVSRMLQDGYTAELTRCCTDGTPHVASKLIARAWRVAQGLGYRRMLSYILIEEKGASYRAAGWRLYGEAGGGKWSRDGRPRVDEHPTQLKLRWEAVS